MSQPEYDADGFPTEDTLVDMEQNQAYEYRQRYEGEENRITVKEIVKQYLVAHGYDRLYSEVEECRCNLEDLMICEARGIVLCKPGYKVDDPTGELEYRIAPEKKDHA